MSDTEPEPDLAFDEERLQRTMAAEALPHAFGAILRQRRSALGLSQSDLALATGVGRRFIIELEAGKPSCQLGKALMVAEALGIRVVDLMEQSQVNQSSTSAGTDLYLKATEPPDVVAISISSPDLPDDIDEPSP